MTNNPKEETNSDELSQEEFYDIFQKAKCLLDEVDFHYDSYPFEKFMKTWKKYKHTLSFGSKGAEVDRIVPIIYFHAYQTLSCLEKSGTVRFTKRVSH
jgi:hypothetical protein